MVYNKDILIRNLVPSIVLILVTQFITLVIREYLSRHRSISGRLYSHRSNRCCNNIMCIHIARTHPLCHPFQNNTSNNLCVSVNALVLKPKHLIVQSEYSKNMSFQIWDYCICSSVGLMLS